MSQWRVLPALLLRMCHSLLNPPTEQQQGRLDVHVKVISPIRKQSGILCAASISQEVTGQAGQKAKHLKKEAMSSERGMGKGVGSGEEMAI